MKTSKLLRFPVNLKLLLVLPVFTLGIIALISCGNKKQETPLSELAPPPPPPPPPAPTMDSVFTFTDEMPLYKGGDAALLKLIADNTAYPEQAKVNGIQGKVIIKFVVEKDCSVTNAEILKGANPLLDEEALRVVRNLPKFEKPAMKAGEPVRVYYTVPIAFALQ
jgi:TonB family protein